jgi:FkbM family methyltransferase
MGIVFPSTDAILWKQIFHLFFLQEYSPSGFIINKGDIVVDIGANRGIFIAFAAFSEAGKIIAYEPDEDNCNYAQALVKLNNFLQVDVMRKAISGRTGVTRFYKAERSTRHTITGVDVVSNAPLSNYEEVLSLSLNDVLQELKHVDLVKMDCEGAEYEIVFNASISTLQKVDKFVIEYHGYFDSKNVQMLVAKLEKAGFLVRVTKNQKGVPFGMLFADLELGEKL